MFKLKSKSDTETLTDLNGPKSDLYQSFENCFETGWYLNSNPLFLIIPNTGSYLLEYWLNNKIIIS
jgi:hypothetical protein